MAIAAAIPPQPAVQPVKDTDRGRPDSQAKRENRKRPHYDAHEENGPSPNERGEITGKVIDVLA